ncbi:PGN_0703 family putative restriction endonuclease [Arthrobacter sp. KN11-1C]|uniref:PGN_0703 family putative restriction endonuclease n=1 Tax=Arthrobacter sp. KN11-1C TaxID=3445774 RepID=UPI003F9F3100
MGSETAIAGKAAVATSLQRIGPQLKGESGLAQRLRFHQSWYRLEILGQDAFGETPRPRERPLGSILTVDAGARGMNFTSSAAQKLYASRRLDGWGLDPIRCTRYLVSSQALMLNVMGPLVQDFAWLTRTLGRVTGRSKDFLGVNAVKIEFAPAKRSEFLGDMTRVDAFIVAETRSGAEGIVLEFKYADRFNSRRLVLSGNPAYESLDEATGLWKKCAAALADSAVNQLVRCHALGAAVMFNLHASMRTTLLAIHHDYDSAAMMNVEKYRSHVSEPERVRGLTISGFLAAMAAEASSEVEVAEVDRLRIRYVDLAGSARSWQMFRGAASQSH